MKLFICGYARHGKDAAAEYLSKTFGFTFDSSSNFAMNLVVRESLKTQYGIEYGTAAECYADRVNNRAKWHKIIAEFNRDDPTRLARMIFRQHDIYVGIRSAVELKACRKSGVGGLILWIDALKRLGTIEGADSMTIRADDCDFVIRNNGSLADLHDKLYRVFSRLASPVHCV